MHGFEDALQLVAAQFACEQTLAAWGVEDPEALAEMAQGHAQIKAALGHAGRVYREEQEAARVRTVARLRQDALAAEAALDDEASRWLGLLAEALDSGDYSGLAI